MGAKDPDTRPTYFILEVLIGIYISLLLILPISTAFTPGYRRMHPSR